MKLHPESAKLFQLDESLEKAKSIAMRLLSGRAYTCRELGEKLSGRGYDAHTVDETLKTLERLRLVDDRAFAQRFVEERMRLKPAGRMLLARDLKRRGVPEAVIEEVLDEAFCEVDAVATAVDVLTRRVGRYQRLSREKALTRMFGFLARRGFDASTAREAAQKVWAQIEEGEDGVQLNA